MVFGCGNSLRFGQKYVLHRFNENRTIFLLIGWKMYALKHASSGLRDFRILY